MDPVTMMVASIGMQFFNNYANNKKSREIQEQQREFQKAAAEHDFERMRKAHAAAAKLALELEAELHNDRLKDIEGNYNSLLKNFAHGFAISNWPLSVLPFIMKGESFGFLFGGSSKSISIHCILTPSNCSWFNEYFYDDLDLRVQAEMNNNWNAQSTHPVVYYGGGWNRRQNNPNGKSIPSLIDLDDIALLKNKLNQIPTMVITPYFDPYLHFRIQLWGMGKDSEMPFRIDIPHSQIKSSMRIFSYDYNKEKKQELTDDFYNTTLTEFVPYLTCLIGFVADKYFWSVYGMRPVLQQYLMNNGYSFTDRLVPFYIKKYETEIEEGYRFIRRGDFLVGDYVDYIKALDTLYSSASISNKINKLISSYCFKYTQTENLSNLEEACTHGIIPKNEINPLINCLSAANKESVTYKQLIKKLSELYQKVDQIYFCYHFREAISIILDNLRNENFAHLRIVDSNVLFVAIYNSKALISFNVCIIHKDLKKTGHIYCLKKNAQRAIRIESDSYLEKLPHNIFPQYVKNELVKYNALLRNMVKLYSQIIEVYPSIFDSADNHIITYKEIVQWSKNHYKQGDCLTILRMLHDDFYYILAYLAPKGEPSLERYMVSKSYYVDSSIIEKMKDKVIFVQQFK